MATLVMNPAAMLLAMELVEHVQQMNQQPVMLLPRQVKRGDTVAMPLVNPRPGAKRDQITVKHIGECKHSVGANLHLNNWCVSMHQPLELIA